MEAIEKHPEAGLASAQETVAQTEFLRIQLPQHRRTAVSAVILGGGPPSYD